MSLNLGAWTARESSGPGFVSINLIAGKVQIQVRSAPQAGEVYGSQAWIELTVDEYRAIAEASLEKLKAAA